MSLESEWPTVEDFVAQLGKALTDEMSTIRQTELDQSGHYEEVFLSFGDSTRNRTQDVFVDRLGRVVLPAKDEYGMLLSVSFQSTNGEGKITKAVVDKEPRYEGTRRSALVIYLATEKEETNHERVD